MKTCLLISTILGAVALQEAARPVEKVVKVLKEMRDNLESEAEADREVYNKMACWCNTNEQEKTAAIDEAEASISSLTNINESTTAAAATLKKEIEILEKEVKSNIQGLNEASDQRRKEMAEFNAQDKDMIETIGALNSAIAILKKKNNPELLQNVQKVVQAGISKGYGVSPEERVIVDAFLQKDFFNSKPIGDGAYANQSGQIFGILRSMKDTFESNQAQAQKDETNKAKQFAEMKASKQEEIAQARQRIENKTGQRAENMRNAANAKEELDVTMETLNADTKFLMDLRMKCQSADAEFNTRNRMRAEEMEGVQKALEILTSDEAHDAFTKGFNSFTQVSAVSERRSEAAELLSVVAHKVHSPTLSALAVQVRLDAFTKVKKAIDDMIAELNKEMKDDVVKKDYCNNQLFAKNKAKALSDAELKNIASNIDVKTNKSKKLAEEIEALNNEVAEIQEQMKRAGENRSKANLEFQQNVKDQRVAQQLLTAALDVLKGVYMKKGGFVQQPEGFGDYQKQGGAGSVLSMLEKIIGESKAEENEMIAAEKDEQLAYEDFHKESSNTMDAKNDLITQKTAEKADTDEDLSGLKNDNEGEQKKNDGVTQEIADLHTECDFYLKNFDMRAQARTDEIEAMRQAKQILSGRKSFMQRRD